MPDVSENRRAFFRIEDEVALDYCLIESNFSCFDEQFPFSDDSALFQLVNELSLMQSEGQQHLRAIGESDRFIAAYLKNVNKRLNLIGRIIASNNQDVAKMPRHCISLSEGGVTIDTVQKIPIGQYVALKLVLLPSFAGIMATGQCIASDAFDNGYRNALSFTHILEQEQQLIARHIIHLQSIQRRDHSNEEGEIDLK